MQVRNINFHIQMYGLHDIPMWRMGGRNLCDGISLVLRLHTGSYTCLILLTGGEKSPSQGFPLSVSSWQVGWNPSTRKILLETSHSTAPSPSELVLQPLQPRIANEFPSSQPDPRPFPPVILVKSTVRSYLWHQVAPNNITAFLRPSISQADRFPNF